MDGAPCARSGPGAADPTPPPPLVVVVDDDPLVRASLDSLFRSVDFATRLHANAREALDSTVAGELACVVTDVRMPELGGFEFQSALNALGAGMPVISMTGHGDVPMSVRAMKAGAVDFLASRSATRTCWTP